VVSIDGFLALLAAFLKQICYFHYLARSANLPKGLYILPSVISFFLLGAKLAQYLLDRFSRSFHQMEGICVNFLHQAHFFRFLKGHCHGNQFCGKITYPNLHISLCHSETVWDNAAHVQD